MYNDPQQNQDDNQSPSNYNYDDRSRKEEFRRPWYNKGWVWLIVAAVGMIILFFCLSGLTEETAKVNQSIQEQTSAIKEQSQIMHSIKEGMNDIVLAIKDAVIAIKESINDLA
jgi:hypothetical protein